MSLSSTIKILDEIAGATYPPNIESESTKTGHYRMLMQIFIGNYFVGYIPNQFLNPLFQIQTSVLLQMDSAAKAYHLLSFPSQRHVVLGHQPYCVLLSPNHLLFLPNACTAVNVLLTFLHTIRSGRPYPLALVDVLVYILMLELIAVNTKLKVVRSVSPYWQNLIKIHSVVCIADLPLCLMNGQ